MDDIWSQFSDADESELTHPARGTSVWDSFPNVDESELSVASAATPQSFSRFSPTVAPRGMSLIDYLHLTRPELFNRPVTNSLAVGAMPTPKPMTFGLFGRGPGSDAAPAIAASNTAAPLAGRFPTSSTAGSGAMTPPILPRPKPWQGGVSGVSLAGAGKDTIVKYTFGDGTTLAVGGAHPVRDNNPLNITNTNWARRHGAIGNDNGFAIFPNEDIGSAAALANFDRLTWNGIMPDNRRDPAYAHGGQVDFWTGGATLADLVNMWSPPSQNRTEEMIRNIAKRSGLNPGDNWSDLTDSQKLDFIHSYGEQEGYKW